jgi:hypothetical protein
MKLSPKLWCLFGVHEYAVLKSGPYVKYGFDGEEVSRCNYYHLRCSVCGKLKRRLI